MKVGDYVKIHSSDEWDGLVGIIHGVVPKGQSYRLAIVCTLKPMLIYYVDENDIERKLTVVE